MPSQRLRVTTSCLRFGGQNSLLNFRGASGRLIFIHLQCWEVLPFLTIQRQWCIKILCPEDPDFYTPLALNCHKGLHLPALEVYKNQSPSVRIRIRIRSRIAATAVRSIVWTTASESSPTREGCGCPKFPAGKVFLQISTLLENDSPIFRRHEMLSLPRFGHFPARNTRSLRNDNKISR